MCLFPHFPFGSKRSESAFQRKGRRSAAKRILRRTCRASSSSTPRTPSRRPRERWHRMLRLHPDHSKPKAAIRKEEVAATALIANDSALRSFSGDAPSADRGWNSPYPAAPNNSTDRPDGHDHSEEPRKMRKTRQPLGQRPLERTRRIGARRRRLPPATQPFSG